MNIFFYIAIFFAVGIALKQLVSKPQLIVDWLNRFIIHIAYPAVILSIIPSMEVTYEILIPTLSYWLLIPITWLSAQALARLFGWSRAVTFVLFFLCIYGNTGFLGVPLVKAFLPEDSAAYALIYDQFGTFLGLSTLGIFLLTRFQNTQASLDWLQLAKKLILFTPFTVLMVSIALPIEDLILPIIPVLSFMGNLIVPAAMIAIGIQFSFKIDKQMVAPLSCLLSLKLVLLPAFMWGMLLLFNVPKNIVSGVVFQAAAAPMITAAALLTSARIESKLVSSALGLGTVFSFVLLPVWAYFLLV